MNIPLPRGSLKAPPLCPHGRSKDIEATGFNGTAAFMEVRVQSIVVEFILTHVEQLFGDAPLCGTSWPGGDVRVSLAGP